MEIDHSLYLFCGRKCDRIKAILKEPDGIVMIYKRLTAQGSYRWPRDKSEVRNLTWREFDWLMSGINPDHADLDRIPTSVVSIGDFASWLHLSRTHLARKLRDAEELGSIGWLGKRGHSVMWVSKAFHQEYMMVQAAKLAVVAAAFEACLDAPRRG